LWTVIELSNQLSKTITEIVNDTLYVITKVKT